MKYLKPGCTRFKYFYVAIVFIAFYTLSCQKSVNEAELNEKPTVVPALQKWTPKSGFYSLPKKAVFSGPDAILNTLSIRDVNAITGFDLQINIDNKTRADIILSIDAEDSLLGSEGYRIDISDQIVIKANEITGLFYGTQTLLQLLKQDSVHHLIPKGSIVDYPLIDERAFMIDVGRKYFSMDYIKRTIRNLAWFKINTLHIHFTEWSGFRLKSDKFPGLASNQAYSKEDLREIQDYAKMYHVMIVPEIDLPAHATKIIRYNPSYGFDCESMMTARWLPDSVNESRAGWVLDMTKLEVRQFISQLLDEFIPLFDAPYFHIGGDEWQYDNQKLACDELMMYTEEMGFSEPGDVFVNWINEINGQVKSYGKTTQIWNWWRFSPNEEFQNRTTIQPDKDIVINVWNRSRKEQILKDGYQVILTPEVGEEALYISPGFGGSKPGDYGFFDAEFIYEKWEPVINSQIQGYKICMWTDRVEDKPDVWFDQFADKPKAILAEKTWGTKSATTIEDFYLILDIVGLSPILN